MLAPQLVEAIAEVADEVEARLLSLVEQRRVAYEEDLTSRLSQDLEATAEREIDGVKIELAVVPSAGPGSSEKKLGADVVGVLRIEVGDMRVAKGFLVQSKRAGTQGVDFVPAEDENPDENDGSGDYSHWTWRDGLHLRKSGTVTVTKPSADLEEQCDNMLKRTPAAFVFVYHRAQIAVVGASAVHALRSAATGTRTPTALGTKRLSDFLVHVADSMIGDRNLAAADIDSIRVLASQENADAALLLSVSSS